MVDVFQISDEVNKEVFIEHREVVLRKVGLLTCLSLEGSASLRRLSEEACVNYEFLSKALESLLKSGYVHFTLANGKTEENCKDDDLRIHITEGGIKAIARTL